MLSASDNELMCRVGPGTPMGNLLREYWIPALAPDDLEPDGPPMRMRLLGEDLIAFKATSGQIGLMRHACPHRGASLFFGRNEEDGLRCVYHGWKFDVTGACVDMPSEPAESNFKNKVRAHAYSVVERNGIVWAYMGSRPTLPPLPELPPNLDAACNVTRRLQESNFMQALEGDIDTVHAGFLHFGHLESDRDFLKGSADYYTIKQREARFEAYPHTIGATYAAVRPAEADSDYWRTGHYLLPFYTMNAPGVLPLKNSAAAWVPLDDENTMVWNFGPQRLQGLDPESQGIGGLKVGVRQTDEPRGRFDPYPQRQAGQRALFMRMFQEDTSDWLGKFRPIANKSNDYLIDREFQADMETDASRPLKGTYSGIPGPGQDPMAQETMGAIYDRTQEHLGTSDYMIIQTRQALIKAAKALRDNGTSPPGVDNPGLYRMRSGGALLPKHVAGMEVLKPVHFMESDTVAIAAEATVGGG
jgi:phenylpropionate dioxygenase-like ring-hydroxylating dioxygenase large terminal subunit